MKRIEMTPEDIAKMERCPDCWGSGTLQTPATTTWTRYVTCKRCGGNGYVKRAATAEKERKK